MGPYYDHAVTIHQAHLSDAEDNRLRRKLEARRPLMNFGVVSRAVLMIGVVLMAVQVV